MEKIKVLHVIGGMNRAGAETFLMNVFRNIDKEKYDFTFLCYGNDRYDYEDEIKSLGGHIERIEDVKKIGIFKHFKELKKIMKKNKYDIVHAHTYYNSVFSILIAYICRIKLRIVHSHITQSEYKPSIYKKIYYFFSKILLLNYSNSYVACSEEAGKSIFGNRRFEIVNNGIEMNRFLFNENERKKLRRKLNISNKDIVVGHVGRFSEPKNHGFLVKIFKELNDINCNYKLIMIGDGVLKQHIQALIKEYNIEKNVIILDSQDKIYDYYNIFDIFLFPSLFEGLGIVLIEAQTNGLKCYISNEIPSSVNISNEIQFIDLSLSAKEWANIINNGNNDRIENMEFLKDSDYDIKNTIKKIEEIYLKGE